MTYDIFDAGYSPPDPRNPGRYLGSVEIPPTACRTVLFSDFSTISKMRAAMPIAPVSISCPPPSGKSTKTFSCEQGGKNSFGAPAYNDT